jgi:hypothetical protein
MLWFIALALLISYFISMSLFQFVAVASVVLVTLMVIASAVGISRSVRYDDADMI